MDENIKKRLQSVSTAALTSALLRHGMRNVWLRGTRPIRTGQPSVVGPAFTLRFVPAREDLTAGTGTDASLNTRAAIENMPEGVVVVADALGRCDAGIVGDVLCSRMVKRNVAGLVTDGAIRDRSGVLATELPIWCGGVAAPPPHASLSFVGWQQPIACGGVAVVPGDIVFADDDGAVIVPTAILESAVAEAEELERIDRWVIREVEQGVPLPGLYPMSPDTKARYESQRGAQS